MNATPLVKGLCTRAAMLVGAFLLLHLFGLRDYTGFLSGTYLLPRDSAQLSALIGALYILSYIGFTILAPIFLIAAALTWLFGRTTHPARNPP